jgi:hypothetical protein
MKLIESAVDHQLVVADKEQSVHLYQVRPKPQVRHYVDEHPQELLTNPNRFHHEFWLEMDRLARNGRKRD